MKAEKVEVVRLGGIVDCCESPHQVIQQMEVPSASPDIMPLYLQRIVCLNCGHTSPWAEDIAVAKNVWTNA